MCAEELKLYSAMPASRPQLAIRAYQQDVRTLLQKYGVPPLAKHPKMQEVLETHRKLLRKVHPDKGGDASDFRAARAAKAALDEAVKATGRAPTTSSPPAPPAQPSTRKRPAAAQQSSAAGPQPQPCRSLVALSVELCPFCTETQDGPARGYRIQSNGVLLTYNGTQIAEEGAWAAFKAWVESNKGSWNVLYYCITMELCRRRRPHFHFMVQFRAAVDWPSSKFAFQGILPNARPTWLDYCREGRNKKNPQQSLDRGFFYVFANKIGTCVDTNGSLCVHGNYGPYWTEQAFLYEVVGDWPEKLWRRYQLTHKQYGTYLIQCRDRVPARKRNLEEVIKGEEELLDAEEIAENAQRIHSNPELYKPFKNFVVAQQWLHTFLIDALRYSLMLVRGFSRSGKTELAKSWFSNPCTLKIGHLLTVFPAKMRSYNRRFHDGIVLDDIRDLQFLVNFQHIFQGKPDEEVGFAENTSGGACAYSKLVFATPFVATFNESAKNLELLDTDDFLSKPENRVVIRLTEPPYETGDRNGTAAPGGALVDATVNPQPLEVIQQWTVADVGEFLQKRDMHGASRIFKQNDVSGYDLATMSSSDFQQRLGLSSFLAEKVVQARDNFLAS